MGCELRLHLTGSAECSLVQRVEILANGTWRFRWVDIRGVPFFLRCRVLFVGLRLDQTGIDGHALTADEAFFNATRHGRLEQVAQQLALAETAVPILREGGMVGNAVV